MKQTKIVATIGPSSWEPEMLSALFEAGVNVCRLNFSHGEYTWHTQCISNIREASERAGKTVAILGDLQGPRIRTAIDEEFILETGSEVLLVEKSAINVGGDIPAIGVDQPNILSQLGEKQLVLVEDGKILLETIRRDENAWVCTTTLGGTIKNRKGMNFPNAGLDLPVLTPKDEADVKFLLDQNVDYIALSFVGRGSDVAVLREKMRTFAPHRTAYPAIVSKVERSDAIDNLDGIIEESDAIMVARGDLGIEVDPWRVAILQKEIIAKCLFRVKPVIVATQMLESMTENLRPTRAEVSDVSNAVIDHADATMLSGETAGGKYPLETVSMMANIIRNTEESPFDDVYETLEMHLRDKYAHMIRQAYETARENEVHAILATSTTGYTGRLLSHFRPNALIYIATEDSMTYRQLSLVWGVNAYLFEGISDEEKLLECLKTKLIEDDVLIGGKNIIAIANEDVRLEKVA
jgi:pyruvate kinase